MNLIGAERIIVEGRIWLQNAYFKIKEIAATSFSSETGTTPEADHIYAYVKDKAGVATPYWTDDAGVIHEFAGTEIVPDIAADYLVKTANATLTAERVVTDTASITVDWSTAGQAKFQREALTGDVTAAQNSNSTTIANDAVTNAKLDNMAAWTLKARNNAASGDPQDVALADLTEEASPASGDYLFGFDSTGALRKINWSNVGTESGAGGHAHGLTRLLGDGSTATFNLVDVAEYVEGVYNDGLREDSNLYTLSADGTQVTFDNTPLDENVLEFHYVIASL